VTSIDEQIAFIDRRIHAGTDAEFYRGILASLERLKSLDAQLVPVEPEYLIRLRNALKGFKSDGAFAGDKNIVDYIDSLQSALKLAQEERDNEKEVRNCISRAYEAEQKRAENAEALAEQYKGRYEWLVDPDAYYEMGVDLDHNTHIDAAIDSARAE